MCSTRIENKIHLEHGGSVACGMCCMQFAECEVCTFIAVFAVVAFFFPLAALGRADGPTDRKSNKAIVMMRRKSPHSNMITRCQTL